MMHGSIVPLVSTRVPRHLICPSFLRVAIVKCPSRQGDKDTKAKVGKILLGEYEMKLSFRNSDLNSYDCP